MVMKWSTSILLAEFEFRFQAENHLTDRCLFGRLPIRQQLFSEISAGKGNVSTFQNST